jgi:hypothetical protein
MAGMKKILAYLFMGWGFILPSSGYAEQPFRTIQKQYFDTFETGLGPLGCCASSIEDAGIWLGDDLFMMTASQPVTDAWEKRLQRVMLINTQAKTSRVLVDSGELVCWNAARQIASLKELGSEKIVKPVHRFIHLDAQGETGPLLEQTDISPYRCRVDIQLPKGTLIIPLQERDGYITESISSENPNNERSTILIRPGKPPVELHVPSVELHYRPIYLPHLRKYLLNTFDSKGDSATDQRLAGRSWKRPYALAPYRLMALDGTIETIPYPEILAEYGVQRFARLLPTNNGILIHAGWRLFLLQGEQLIQFWPRPGAFGLTKKDHITGMMLSPDGCKIAFRHYPDDKFTTPQLVTVINLCKKV